MAEEIPIADDEIVYRHIPGVPDYQQPPDRRITSANFRLRAQDTGISVTRAAITSPEKLLAVTGGNPAKGSRVAAARVSDIAALGLTTIPCNTDDDAGHAELRSNTADLNDRHVRRELAKLFRFV